jgi:hypothetical protein
LPHFELKAAGQYAQLPARIKSPIVAIIARLKHWPNTSGAKPLRENRAEHYRIRTVDYCLQFFVKRVEAPIGLVAHHDGFY